MRDADRSEARRVWAAPASIAAATACGLVGALVGDGAWDVLACAMLAGAAGYVGAVAYARRS
ncbi:UNVERIFIED_CONTAM: hypothetical protein Q9R58_13925 [Methylobacteriaceae bacterium AG10]|jgi:hypothetical protein|nr:hypothetical protein [Methylobacteriaceae bacterium AG10]